MAKSKVLTKAEAIENIHYYIRKSIAARPFPKHLKFLETQLTSLFISLKYVVTEKL